MCRGRNLLNGVTPIVPPVRLSPHPRTKLLDGDWPPVVRRPRPSGRGPAYRYAPPWRIRFLPEASRPRAGEKLLSNCCSQYLAGLAIDERKPQRVGAESESAQHARALAGGVGVGPDVTIDERAGQGAIDEDGELARGGGEGLGLADADGQAAVEGTERGLAPDEAQGSHPQHGGGAIGGRLGAGAEAPASGDLVLGGEREPRREVLLGGPSREVGPDLGEELERGIGGDAIDLGEVGAGQVVERRANVEGRFIPVAAGHAWAGQRGRGRVGRGGQGLQLGLDGGVAGGELGLTENGGVKLDHRAAV